MKRTAFTFITLLLLGIFLYTALNVSPVMAACPLGDLSSATIGASTHYDKNLSFPNTISIQNAPESFRGETLWVFLVSQETTGEPGSTTGGSLGSIAIDTLGNGQLQFTFAEADVNIRNIRNGQAVILFSTGALYTENTTCTPLLPVTITGSPTCLGLGQPCVPNDPTPPSFCNPNAICNPQTNQVSIPQSSTFDIVASGNDCLYCEISPEGVTLGCQLTDIPAHLDRCEVLRKSRASVTCGPNNTGVNTALGCIDVASPGQGVGALLLVAIGIGGGLALLLMGYGVFVLTTSAGIPEKINEGKQIITSAAGGLLFIVLSVVIYQIIAGILNLPGLVQ